LKALCQEAALVAMARATDGHDGPAAVTHDDFEEGLRRLRQGSTALSAL
jgi:hypothetical protein